MAPSLYGTVSLMVLSLYALSPSWRRLFMALSPLRHHLLYVSTDGGALRSAAQYGEQPAEQTCHHTDSYKNKKDAADTVNPQIIFFDKPKSFF